MHDNARSARSHGLVGCRDCGHVWPMETHTCTHCGKKLKSRDTEHLQKVWAWWFAGVLCYIPANIYPMLSTRTLVSQQSATIIGGAVDLAHHGAFFVAAIIIFASVMIPVAKFMAIAYLAFGASGHLRGDPHTRHRIFGLVEFIGRWSMIDVFVVAILSALVQLGSVASIHPGPAALTFCLSVIFTMLSAQSFDAKSIWDLDETEDGEIIRE